MPTINWEAEVSVLGTILVDGTLFKDLTVQEDYFSKPSHRQIFRAMKEVADADEGIDIVTVTTVQIGRAHV